MGEKVIYFKVVTSIIAMTDPLKDLTYVGTRFFRIIKGVGMYGGDMINNDGTSGETASGMVQRDENLKITHNSRYLLTMTKPKDTAHTFNS